MNTLFILIHDHYQEYLPNFLDLFSVLAIFCAILTITNKNPIVSVLFLICLFVLISGYLILIGMNFIGISYLLVYIGAISILFLFILMLINVRVSEIQTETSNSIPLAILISILFYSILYETIPFLSPKSDNSHDWTTMMDYNDKINYVVSHQWDTNLIEVLQITSIGNILYTNFFLWLIIASIILLLAMVGAIIITIKS